jgi:hypothetical protein
MLLLFVAFQTSDGVSTALGDRSSLYCSAALTASLNSSSFLTHHLFRSRALCCVHQSMPSRYAQCTAVRWPPRTVLAFVVSHAIAQAVKKQRVYGRNEKLDA